MNGVLWLETPCEHGWVFGHLFGDFEACPGGSRRRVTVDALQRVLDATIDNLLPDDEGMAIDVDALLEWAADRTETP